MRFRRFVRQLHRWLGLLIALQLLCWVGGGLVMSALALDAVRGRDRAHPVPVPALAADPALLAPADLLRDRDDVVRFTLTHLHGNPVYRLDAGSGPTLIDARDGRLLSPLPQDVAEAVARSDYSGDGRLAGVDWVETPGGEYRGHDLPLWRVRFDDDRNTALYVSPQTGEVVARRNRLWRAFDFVWMLHIMDYRERENFNHPLLVTTAATTLLFVGSGLLMLFYSFRPIRSRPR